MREREQAQADQQMAELGYTQQDGGLHFAGTGNPAWETSKQMLRAVMAAERRRN